MNNNCTFTGFVAKNAEKFLSAKHRNNNTKHTTSRAGLTFSTRACSILLRSNGSVIIQMAVNQLLPSLYGAYCVKSFQVFVSKLRI